MLSTKNTGVLPGAQEKRQQPPLSIQIRQNVRIEDRIEAMLRPSDAKYKETEKYFAELLQNSDWTIARIVDEHFSPHEAKKFNPTQDETWSELQANDTRGFETLLQTTWKGTLPTLSMKMALLYHGFTVAPMKIGHVQDVVPQDYQHLIQRENRVIQDPLNFLEGYTERTWGETPPDPSFQPRRVPLVTEAMGLRGGALDDSEIEDMMSDEEPLADTGHTKSKTKRVFPPSLFVHPRRNRYADDKKVMEKRTTIYDSQAEFRTGSGTHESMRKQAWWAPPSIFANPLKPVMPLHAAPLETVIRTGPSVPSVSLGLRTSTEMARLEREVHMLRGHLLDRSRECPYHDCHRFFHYLDTKSFEDHFTQEHAIVRCTLCLAFAPTKKHAGMLYLDRKQIIEHILNDHSEQLTAFFSVPNSDHAMPSQPPTRLRASLTSRPGYPFCGRCGRNNTKCCEAEDLENHMFRCAVPSWSPDSGPPPAYCESCGTKTGSCWPYTSCPDSKCVSHNPKLPGEDRFCHKCGLRWKDKYSDSYKARHASGCNYMGGMDDSFCVHCGVSLHGVQNHDEVCSARNEPSGTHNAEQNPHPGGYGDEHAEDNIRNTTEVWDSTLYQGFEPEPDSHCSRCFLQAQDCVKPELHANKDLSCNIYWGKGSAENLPNVSGWVSRRDLEASGSTADEVLRHSARDFVSKYSDYTPTISNAYLQQTTTQGGRPSDPNVDVLTDKLTMRYPWPPSDKRPTADTQYPWPPSNKRPTADPQSCKRPTKKRRQVIEDSSSEPPSDGDDVLDSDYENEDEDEELPAEGLPWKVLFPKHCDTSVKPQGEAFGTQAMKQEQNMEASTLHASQPPASRQESAAPAATAAQPETTRHSATPTTRQASVARQRSATPTASNAKKSGASYPWPGPKAKNLEEPAVGLVEVTVGGLSQGSWGGNPETATQTAATTATATPASVGKPPAPAMEKAQVSRPEGGTAAATPQQTPATTRSGRTVRMTRAAAELQGQQSVPLPAGSGEAGKNGHDDDGNDKGKAAKDHTPVAKKGRPKKGGGQ